MKDYACTLDELISQESQLKQLRYQINNNQKPFCECTRQFPTGITRTFSQREQNSAIEKSQTNTEKTIDVAKTSNDSFFKNLEPPQKRQCLGVL